MEEERLGKIMWEEDPRKSGRCGMMILADGKTVNFDTDAPRELLTEEARNSIKFVLANERLVRHKIAAAMTEVYKEWHDGAAITAEELARRITLKDVSFYEEGDGQLYYTTEPLDMFGGHWICVHFDANGEIDEPELEG